MTEFAAVVVVGAGPAGLATSQQLSAQGIAHRVFERGDSVGYTWAHLYDSLTLHTGKHMSGLPGMPLPRSAPLFVPRREFWEYLRDYARAFALPVETGRAVERIERSGAAWILRTSGGTCTARVLVVATGIVANPRTPRFLGADRFRGRMAHSVTYRRPDAYVGRRVLVVGVGNSGAEIASEIARAGGKVTMAVRSGANVVPRTLAGLPIQYVGYWVRKLPRSLQERVVGLVSLLSELQHGPPVLPRPSHGPLDAIPVIGFQLVDAIAAGLIEVCGGVAELTADGARFTDGTAGRFDDVILATGFAAALEPLGSLVEVDPKGFARRRDRVVSLDQPSLYLVGHNYDASGGLHNINRDARVAARLIARTLAAERA
ncbi:MAG TPA: NAD(P)/FAD-dependent oxidoreductase [Gemmatimonadales bacterium]|nr:NAD(P)/FAD-dependent oxidoreductase [Gemmatimonadales bacterium]